MKIVNRTRRVSRRGFLAGGAAAIATIAVSGPVALAEERASATQPAALQPGDVRTLVKLTRDLFPHDRLDDSFYEKAVAPLRQEAVQDVTTCRLLTAGCAELDGFAAVAAGVRYARVADEQTRVAALKKMESSAFFTKVYAVTIVSLYNQPELWPKFGYPGPSSDQGGYLHRGFSDIDWL
jgi:hypothetical protein